jgi:hypothetical protein
MREKQIILRAKRLIRVRNVKSKAFNCLGIGLADDMCLLIQMSLICPQPSVKNRAIPNGFSSALSSRKAASL